MAVRPTERPAAIVHHFVKLINFRKMPEERSKPRLFLFAMMALIHSCVDNMRRLSLKLAQ